MKTISETPVNTEFLEIEIKRRSTNHSWRPRLKVKYGINKVKCVHSFRWFRYNDRWIWHYGRKFRLVRLYSLHYYENRAKERLGNVCFQSISLVLDCTIHPGPCEVLFPPQPFGVAVGYLLISWSILLTNILYHRKQSTIIQQNKCTVHD